MSCGNPHELPCTDALLEGTGYLDGEISEAEVHRLWHHFEECPPCRAQNELEALVKALVQRSCAQPQAPQELVQLVQARIEHVQVTITQHGPEAFGFVVEHTVEEW